MNQHDEVPPTISQSELPKKKEAWLNRIVGRLKKTLTHHEPHLVSANLSVTESQLPFTVTNAPIPNLITTRTPSWGSTSSEYMTGQSIDRVFGEKDIKYEGFASEVTLKNMSLEDRDLLKAQSFLDSHSTDSPCHSAAPPSCPSLEFPQEHCAEYHKPKPIAVQPILVDLNRSRSQSSQSIGSRSKSDRSTRSEGSLHSESKSSRLKTKSALSKPFEMNSSLSRLSSLENARGIPIRKKQTTHSPSDTSSSSSSYSEQIPVFNSNFTSRQAAVPSSEFTLNNQSNNQNLFLSLGLNLSQTHIRAKSEVIHPTAPVSSDTLLNLGEGLTPKSRPGPEEHRHSSLSRRPPIVGFHVNPDDTPKLKRPATVGNVSHSHSVDRSLSSSSYRSTQPGHRSQHVVKETKEIYDKLDPTPRGIMLVSPHGGFEEAQGKVNQYHILSDIASGSFGKVFLCRHEVEGRYYACKVVSKSRLMKNVRRFRKNLEDPSASNEEHLQTIKKEIAILKKLSKHKNINALVEVLDDSKEDNLYMIFELCEYGPILAVKVNEKVRPYCEAHARVFFRDMVLGIEYLHIKGIVHRDIKPENILINSSRVVQIADFGISHDCEGSNDLLSDKNATLMFSPPEAIATNQELHGKAADIWALGVTLYSLVHGYLPFDEIGMFELCEKIEKEEPVYSRHLSPELVDLLQMMLKKTPSERATIAKIRKHDWVTVGGQDPLISVDENICVYEEVTEEEVEKALSPVTMMLTKIRTTLERMRSRSKTKNRTASKERPRTTSEEELVACRFHVFGKVQGVFFRKYTAAKANSLCLQGWVKNNNDKERSVEGFVQGPSPAVAEFRDWVRFTGSPKSKITDCKFYEREFNASLGPGFIVRK